MNGGAWLKCAGEKVDVILRDLDVVEHWTRRAQEGEFDRDALLGYVAGIPTTALAQNSPRVARSTVTFRRHRFRRNSPSAPPVRRFCRSFSLDYARMHAKRGNLAGAAGQAAAAVMQEAHAIVCERSQWVCNEKRLIETAGLGALHARFAEIPIEPGEPRPVGGSCRRPTRCIER